MHSIFIVDDEETTRNGLCSYVDWAALNLSVAGSADDGASALPLLLCNPPEILLTDVKMPFMDGITLARQVREKLPETRIVFLSGYSDTEYLRSAIHIGAIDYLLKPIDFDELNQCMGRLILLLDQTSTTVADSRQEPSDGVENAAVARIMLLMKEQYARSITVQSLAEQVYLSPNYLSTLFHRKTGKTINDALTEIRVDQAKEMLEKTHMRLGDISAAVGWQNPSYFTKQFSKLTGQTPLEYRNGKRLL